MKNLKVRLQDEAGLSEEQAGKAVSVFRDYLVDMEDDPNIVEAIKLKAANMSRQAKEKYEDFTDKAEDTVDKVGDTITDYALKVGDKADDLIDKAKAKAKIAVDKLSDYLSE